MKLAKSSKANFPILSWGLSFSTGDLHTHLPRSPSLLPYLWSNNQTKQNPHSLTRTHTHTHRVIDKKKMASLAQQVGGLRCPSISTTRLSRKQHINTTTTPTLKSRKSRTIRMGFLKGVRVISNAQTKERERLREMFNDAYERCLREPSDGVAFSTDNFRAVIEKHGIEAEMGTTRVSSSPIFFNYLF